MLDRAQTIEILKSSREYLSPTGMEKLDAACMVLIALGESVKTLDKLTGKQLLPTYPSFYLHFDFDECAFVYCMPFR